MRNLKKLFAVLIAVAMIASLMVPALAAVAYQDEALKLQAIKVFAGGPDDLKLDEGVTRAQGLAFAIRVAGKEAEAQALTDEEVDEILADWVDASDLTGGAAWARKYVAYAIKTGMTVGVGGQKLAALEDITGTSLMVFVMKAMGYSEATTANIAELVVEKGVMSLADATKFAAIQSGLIRDDAAGILYNAFANGVNKDGTKLIDSYIASGAITEADAIAAGFVEALDAVTASAIGAKKIEVKFNKAVEDTSKVTIEIKRGNIKPAVKETKWADDKKSAVVEFTSNLPTDDYTVTVTGATEEALTYSFAVEAAKLVSIEFTSDIAVKDGNNITARVKALNQYGEDVNIAGANVTASKGSNPQVDGDGIVTVQGAADTFKVDDKVIIVIIKDAVSVTHTLTVANAATVESIEFGTVQTSKDDYKDKDLRVSYLAGADYGEFYLPITVKDQYGNVLKANQLQVGFKILTSSANIVNVKELVEADDDGNTVVKFNQTTAPATSGTVVLTAVASETGKTANATIVVKDDAKIDIVTISSPEKDLKQGIAVELPVELIDTYGETVSLYDQNITPDVEKTELKFNDVTMTVNGGKFKAKTDYVEKVTTIEVTPDANSTFMTIIATSATGKSQTLSFSVLAAPKAVAIKGMKSDFVSMLSNDVNMKTSIVGNVEFLDQYGDLYEGATPTYTVVAKSSDATTVSGNDIFAKAIDEKKTDKFTVTLTGTGLSEDPSIEVEITVIPFSDIAEFEVKDIGKIYSGAEALAGSTYSKELKVVGKVDGKEVAIPQTIVSAGNIGIQSIDSGKAGIQFITTGDAIKSNIAAKVGSKDGGDETAKAKVTIVTDKTVVIIEKEYVFSEAAPAVATIEIKKGDDTVTDAVSMTKAQLESLNLTSGDLKFVAKDQYGVETSAGFTFFITNNDAGVTLTTDTITGTGLETGKSFVINAINNGILQSIKVIVGQ